MTIGEKIKKLRLNLGMTQIELADRINVSKQTLYKYEKGIVTNIPSNKIEELANVLNTTPSYLMGWKQSIEPDEFNSILNEINYLIDYSETKQMYYIATVENKQIIVYISKDELMGLVNRLKDFTKYIVYELIQKRTV